MISLGYLNLRATVFDLWDASREKKEKQMEAFSHAWNKIKNKSKMVDWVKK